MHTVLINMFVHKLNLGVVLQECYSPHKKKLENSVECNLFHLFFMQVADNTTHMSEAAVVQRSFIKVGDIRN